MRYIDRQIEELKASDTYPRDVVKAMLLDAVMVFAARDELLTRCAAQFRKYERDHLEKARVARTEGMNGSMNLMHDEKGSLAKAEVNKKFAEEIEALLKEAV